MTVNVIVSPPAYSKAPIGHPIPDPTLFPFATMIGNQPTWLSVPMPDKLQINGLLLREHFSSKMNLALEEYGPWLMSKLASKAIGAVLKTKYVQNTGTYTVVARGFGQASAPVFFEIAYAKANETAAHRLTIQCNPSRLAEEGFFELLDQFQKLTDGLFCFGGFLADARVSLLDVAVDVVGANLSDLMVRTKNQGLTACYVPDEGGLQSYSIHRKLKPKLTTELTNAKNKNLLGDLIARVYDKRAERIANGHPPKFGDAPETRVEVQKKRFGNKPFCLPMLRHLANPLSKIVIGVVRDVLPNHGARWLRYAYLRQTVSHEAVLSIMPLSAKDAETFQVAYRSFPVELVTVKSIWERWADGIEAVGLHYLIEAAEQKSTGVPLPV